MSSMSPSSVLYSSDGYELAVQDNAAIIPGTRALLISGIDSAGNSHYNPASLSGVLGAAQMDNNVPVQVGATVTASGSALITTSHFGTQEIAVVVNVGTVTGGGSIQYTIQEVDPGDSTTVYGSSASTAVINTGNTPAVFTAVLNVTTSSKVKLTWTVVSTFSATIYSTIVCKTTPSTQTINGSISATNPSVGTDGAAALGFDTQVGGVVSTAAPTYTNGNLNALSLTTGGLLRIDGVYPVNATTPTTDATFVAGAVTTAAPTYTTGQMSALSLTTAGALRVDGSAVVQPVSGTVTANQGTSPWVTNVSQFGGNNVVTGTGASGAGIPRVTVSNDSNILVTQSTSPWIVAGGGTAGTPATGVVTVQGISGMTPLSVITNKAATSSVTSIAGATTNTNIFASNANRVVATIFNGTNKTMYIKLGTTASTSSFTTQLLPNSYWELPVDWTGNVDAVWANGVSGNALVTEMSP